MTTVDFTAEKSLLDRRDYRYVELDNGLKVLLISEKSMIEIESQLKVDSVNETCSSADEEASEDADEETEERKAAAAICVNVGSNSDPLNAQGLAHFLEHMLFMGNEKYPDENAFEAYLTKYGGMTNAWTQNEHTMFYFNVNAGGFAEAFDRFVHFFVSPLLKTNAVDRELNAVDNEFELAKKRDSSRNAFILDSCAKKDSPICKFSYGNRVSLNDIPQKTGTDVYALLKQFRLDHYSANRMTMSLLSTDSLDDMESLVRTTCASIYCNLQSVKPTFAQDPYATEQFVGSVKIAPIEDKDKLAIHWAMPSMLEHIDSIPLQVFSSLFGHEGSGSLCSYLRKKNYALDVESYMNSVTDDSYQSSFYTLALVQINLTEHGLDMVDDVIEAVCAYIAQLKSAFAAKSADIVRYLDEFTELHDISARYMEMKEENDTVVDLAHMLHLLSKDKIHRIFNAYTVVRQKDWDLYHRLLNEYFRPERMNVMLQTKKFQPDSQWKKDEWFQVDHLLCPYTSSQLDKWRSDQLVGEFHLPKVNEFIPKNFQVIESQPDDEYPVDLSTDTAIGHLWHRQSTKLSGPRAHMNLILSNGMVGESARNVALLLILKKALNEYLNEHFYEAIDADAGISVSSSEHYGYLEISLDGFSDVLPKLFKKIVKSIFNSSWSLTDVEFDKYLSYVRKNCYNKAINPRNLNISLYQSIMNGLFDYERLSEALAGPLTRQALLEFKRDFETRAYLQFYMNGNLSREQSRECYDYACSVIAHSTEAVPGYYFRPVQKQKHGWSRVRAKNFNETSVNSFVSLVVFISSECFAKSSGFQLSTMNMLLVRLLDEPVFNYLRTIKCLGYIAGVNNKEVHDSPLLDGFHPNWRVGLEIKCSAQANRNEMNKVSGLVLAFWRRAMPCILNCMTDDDFETAKQGLIDELRIPAINLKDEDEKFYHVGVVRGSYIFDHVNRQVAILSTLTRGQFIQFMQEAYLRESTSILIEVEGNKDANDDGASDEAVSEPQNVGTKPVKLQFIQLTEADNEQTLAIEAEADVERSHQCTSAKGPLKFQELPVPSLWACHHSLKLHLFQ